MDSNLKLKDWVGRMVDVVIDRPMSTTHPRDPEFVYPINYGYVPGTMAPDGHPIDAYVLGTVSPLRTCSARVIAVIRRRDDVEDRLVATLSGVWSWPRSGNPQRFRNSILTPGVELPESGEGQ